MSADPRFWDQIAESYARKPVDDEAAFERKKEIVRNVLTPTSQVVEVGCGTGSLALDLAASAGHIHAIDLSAEMVRIARGKAEAQGVGNATFHKADVATLPPLEAGSFQCALAFSVLHLVEDRPALLNALFDLLEPGGTLVSSTVCLGGSYVPYGLILPVMRWFGKAPPVWILKEDTLRSEIEAAGFVSVEAPDVGTGRDVVFLTARRP